MAAGFPKDYIDSNELTKEQILKIVDLSIALKKCIKNGYYPHLLQDKTLAPPVRGVGGAAGVAVRRN